MVVVPDTTEVLLGTRVLVTEQVVAAGEADAGWTQTSATRSKVAKDAATLHRAERLYVLSCRGWFPGIGLTLHIPSKTFPRLAGAGCLLTRWMNPDWDRLRILRGRRSSYRCTHSITTLVETSAGRGRGMQTHS
jgi:hypothetical protein